MRTQRTKRSRKKRSRKKRKGGSGSGGSEPVICPVCMLQRVFSPRFPLHEESSVSGSGSGSGPGRIPPTLGLGPGALLKDVRPLSDGVIKIRIMKYPIFTDSPLPHFYGEGSYRVANWAVENEKWEKLQDGGHMTIGLTPNTEGSVDTDTIE